MTHSEVLTMRKPVNEIKFLSNCVAGQQDLKNKEKKTEIEN